MQAKLKLLLTRNSTLMEAFGEKEKVCRTTPDWSSPTDRRLGKAVESGETEEQLAVSVKRLQMHGAIEPGCQAQ